MYALYWTAFTGAFAPQVVLEESGAAYERIDIDISQGQHQTPEFLVLNPMGQIPVLKLPDGSVITEAAAIMLYLADVYPQAQLLPPLADPARAQAYRWLFFLSSNVYETALRDNYPHRYTTDANGSAGVKEAALQRWVELFQQIESVLDPYFLGEQFSLVDIYLFMLITWYAQQDQLFADFPRIRQLYELVRIRPAVARIWAQHFPD